MSRFNLIEKYQRLFEKCSSTKSSDFARATIYQFQKYCKCCGQGMVKPQFHDRREIKKLFKQSFCAPSCLVKGPVEKTITVSNKKNSGFKNKDMPIDDLAMLSLEIQRKEKNLPPFIRFINDIDAQYKMLSEKLSALEILTGEKWYASKFYYWVERANF